MAVYYKWIKGCSEGSTLGSGLWSYIKWAGNSESVPSGTINDLPYLYVAKGKKDDLDTSTDKVKNLGYFLTNNATGVVINKPWEFNQITFNGGKYYIHNYQWSFKDEQGTEKTKDILYIGKSGNEDPSTETYVGTNYFRIPLADQSKRDVFATRRIYDENKHTTSVATFTAPIIIGSEFYLDDSFDSMKRANENGKNVLDRVKGNIIFGVGGDIDANGKIESYNSVHAPYFNATSDMRAKENIKKLPFSALAFINNLNVYQFNYKGKNDTIPGVLAQDVLNSQPEGLSLVDNIDASGENGDYMSIKEDKFIFLLMRAVQELKEDNDALRYEIEQLKQKLK